MKIGIDISQVAYEKTGVANFVRNLVENLVLNFPQHEYKLFYSSLRKELPESRIWEKGGKIIESILPKNAKVTISQFKIPPSVLDILWNRLHIVPVEKFIGNVDVFISSDWTQPPSNAKKITVLYDLIVYKYPRETSKKIVSVQKRKLAWVKKEVDKVICISESSKKDAEDVLGIPANKLDVVYPGMSI